MKTKIKAFIKNSLLDWDGKVVSVVYLAGCNFRCPFCHNAQLILAPEGLETVDFNEVINYVSNNAIFVDGVCVTGGEPCLYEDLPNFLRRFKSKGILVKLDTNGSYPEMLKKIIDSNLADYIAMDVKSSLDESLYLEACGIQESEIVSRVKESIDFIMSCGVDYEFRITVVPALHGKKEIYRIAKSVQGAKKLALQNFSNHKTLNPEFENIKPYAIKELEGMAEGLKDYVQECVVRGG